MYSYTVNFFTRHVLSQSWTETKIRDLEEMIKEFKMNVYIVISKYQLFKMSDGTSNFHALDHMVESLLQVGSAEYLHGGLYDHIH